MAKLSGITAPNMKKMNLTKFKMKQLGYLKELQNLYLWPIHTKK